MILNTPIKGQKRDSKMARRERDRGCELSFLIVVVVIVVIVIVSFTVFQLAIKLTLKYEFVASILRIVEHLPFNNCLLQEGIYTNIQQQSSRVLSQGREGCLAVQEGSDDGYKQIFGITNKLTD